MKLHWAFLAEAASVGHGGKIDALGIGIDNLEVPGFPSLLPIIYLVAKIEFTGETPGDLIPIELKLRQKWDSEVLAELTFTAPVPEPRPEAVFPQANLITVMANVKFNGAGDHVFELTVGSGEIKIYRPLRLAAGNPAGDGPPRIFPDPKDTAE